MIFKPKKSQAYSIIFLCILITIVGVFLFHKYITTISIRTIGLCSCSIVIIPLIITAIQDPKSTIYVDGELLHYKRAGQDIKVRWEDIGRIEYSNRLKFVKALDCMIIYTGSGLLYIDYTIENYLQLWQFIISNYQQLASEPNIDDQLNIILSKRKFENTGDGSVR